MACVSGGDPPRPERRRRASRHLPEDESRRLAAREAWDASPALPAFLLTSPAHFTHLRTGTHCEEWLRKINAKKHYYPIYVLCPDKVHLQRQKAD